MASFTPTMQQHDVIEYFEAQFGPDAAKQTLFIDAVAGSGKTSTLMLLAPLLSRYANTRYRFTTAMCAFNAHIATELTNRLKDMSIKWPTCEGKTLHSLGNALLSEAYKNRIYPKNIVKQDEDKKDYKYDELVEDHLGKYENILLLRRAGVQVNHLKTMGKIKTAIKTLVDFARQTMVEPDEENLIELIFHYDLDIEILNPAWGFICNAVPFIIKRGIKVYEETGEIDFTDMIYLPLVLGLTAPIYDVLFIDEAQDLNKSKLDLIRQVLKPEGFMIFVGDPFQAIQGFSGSDTDSVNNIVETMHAQKLPLSQCFRCDQKIIDLAAKLVPHIEARDGAPEGIVEIVPGSVYISQLRTGWYDLDNKSNEKDPDAVLCRINADLVSGALACIAQGKHAIVRGHNIGGNVLKLLAKIIRHAGFEEVNDADFKLYYQYSAAYRRDEIARLQNYKNPEAKTKKLEDGLSTLDALMAAYLDKLPKSEIATVEGFKCYIESFVQDGENGKGKNGARSGVKPIIFSSVHRAKGLEYDRVFIIRPELMPFPMAKLDWQIQQEMNILYVAITRAKHELYFVDSMPLCLIDKVETPAPIIEVEEAVEEPVVVAKHKGGRPATGRLQVRKQYSLDPVMVSLITNTAQKRKEAGEMIDGKLIDESKLLAAIIKASPLYQALLAEQQDTDDKNDGGPEDDPSGGVAILPPINTVEEEEPVIEQQPAPSLEALLVLEREVDMMAAAEMSGLLPYTWIYDENTPISHQDEVDSPDEDEDDSTVVEWLQDDSTASTDQKNTIRMFFSHKYGKCKHVWTIDYYRRSDGKLYRSDSDGVLIPFADDPMRKCQVCGKSGRGEKLKAKHSKHHKCNDVCKHASGPSCTCSCGGKYHGSHRMIGNMLFSGVE